MRGKGGREGERTEKREGWASGWMGEWVDGLDKLVAMKV